ncbi:LOW QUALITY PROTEIN: hypothetical protein U9M48_031634 [Paspalum notatum var. saurae]|uniref:HAT C-terminal dimerisation domain-containing protein n=1 Tax=Paspalum notatum var. saurae TaxID=547442 RepID=A0AAQ3U783_PASNO
MGISLEKLPTLDVSTRWNSTYLMLESAYSFRAVFAELAKQDQNFTTAPSLDEWERSRAVCSFLKTFFDATLVLSGSSYPTIHHYFHQLWKIKLAIDKESYNKDQDIAAMAKNMEKKFKQYWEISYLSFSIPVILDPRFKNSYVDFRFKQFFGLDAAPRLDRVMSTLKRLFRKYSQVNDSNADLANKTSNLMLKRIDSFDDWDQHRNAQKRRRSSSELNAYLAENTIPRTDDFDILDWWKSNSATYPVLACMARDVLSTPATTVPSESAFSTGQRVVIGGPFTADIEQIIRDRAFLTQSPVISACDPGIKSVTKCICWDDGKPYQRCDISIKILDDMPLSMELHDVNLQFWEITSVRMLSQLPVQLCVSASIQAGLEETQLPGRSQFLMQEEASALGVDGTDRWSPHRSICKGLIGDVIETVRPEGPLAFVVGMANDKEHLAFARQLLLGRTPDVVLLTEASIAGGASRTMPASSLKDVWIAAAQDQGIDYLDIGSISSVEALEHARDLVGAASSSSGGRKPMLIGCYDATAVSCGPVRAAAQLLLERAMAAPGLVCVTGSLHVAAAMLQQVNSVRESSWQMPVLVIDARVDGRQAGGSLVSRSWGRGGTLFGAPDVRGPMYRARLVGFPAAAGRVSQGTHGLAMEKRE